MEIKQTANKIHRKIRGFANDSRQDRRGKPI